MSQNSSQSPQDHAEATDPSTLGHGPDDDGLPGIEDFPPERPLGVEDPAILQGGSGTSDDLVLREWRENEPSRGDERGIRIAAQSSGEGGPTASSDEARATSSPSAEQAAVTIVDEGLLTDESTSGTSIA